MAGNEGLERGEAGTSARTETTELRSSCTFEQFFLWGQDASQKKFQEMVLSQTQTLNPSVTLQPAFNLDHWNGSGPSVVASCTLEQVSPQGQPPSSYWTTWNCSSQSGLCTHYSLGVTFSCSSDATLHKGVSCLHQSTLFPGESKSSDQSPVSGEKQLVYWWLKTEQFPWSFIGASSEIWSSQKTLKPVLNSPLLSPQLSGSHHLCHIRQVCMQPRNSANHVQFVQMGLVTLNLIRQDNQSRSL